MKRTPGGQVRVLIVDDHPIVAAAMGMTLETGFAAEVTITHDCATALAMLANGARFDMVLLDLNIPGESAADNLAAMRVACPALPLVVFSGSDDPAQLRLALAMDVHGFLPKSSQPELLEAALRLVLAGGRYLPETVRSLALAGDAAPAAAAGPGPAASGHGAGTELTARQLQVLERLASGCPNKQIARELGISPFTAKAHVAQLLLVLGATNRTEAVALARQRALI